MSHMIRTDLIFHNYVITHEGLNGKTPSKACGIKISEDNKWIP